jgi:thiol peroxidase
LEPSKRPVEIQACRIIVIRYAFDAIAAWRFARRGRSVSGEGNCSGFWSGRDGGSHLNQIPIGDGGRDMKLVKWMVLGMGVLLIAAMGVAQDKPEVNTSSTKPGGLITFRGNPLSLLGTPIAEGQRMPSVPLVDAMAMKEVDLSKAQGKVLFLSIVPSVDTPVCEVQTHYLGEEGDKLPQDVERITISRDTPFAQKRFAKEANLTDIRYLSDYKRGEFGRSTGLLIEGFELLGRAVILVDKEGIVRYIQVVPELTELPDMEAAFAKAAQLAEK